MNTSVPTIADLFKAFQIVQNHWQKLNRYIDFDKSMAASNRHAYAIEVNHYNGIPSPKDATANFCHHYSADWWEILLKIKEVFPDAEMIEGEETTIILRKPTIILDKE